VRSWEAASLRSRIYSPFEALANRAGRRKRLSGRLEPRGDLARADLKLRTSEFVMIQVAFLLAERRSPSCALLRPSIRRRRRRRVLDPDALCQVPPAATSEGLNRSCPTRSACCRTP